MASGYIKEQLNTKSGGFLNTCAIVREKNLFGWHVKKCVTARNTHGELHFVRVDAMNTRN